jgi:hypothetical protein
LCRPDLSSNAWLVLEVIDDMTLETVEQSQAEIRMNCDNLGDLIKFVELF